MADIPYLPKKLAEDITKVEEGICPQCGGELDTGWECNDCGCDAAPLVVMKFN